MAPILHSDSPIRRLNKDVLSTIFMSNADMFTDEAALNTTWETSQVCMEWRSILLDSPAIWGRLLDMDILQWGQRKWGREILRRSGTSSALWIRATGLDNRADYGDSTRTKKLLFSILDDHWERVERLILDIAVTKIHPTHWRVLYEPAPLLQIFDVQMHGANTKDLASVNPLFNNAAPSLHTFRTQGLKFGLQAPCFGGLRSVSFRDDSLDLVDLLKMLAMMPLLADFKFEKIVVGGPVPSYSDLPTISLPQLKKMTISLNIAEWDALLEHVIPAKGCSIVMHDFKNMLDSAIPETVSLRRLAVLTEEFVKVHQPSCASICVRSSTFCFELKDRHQEDASFFKIAIFLPFGSSGFTAESLSTLLSICSTSSLNALPEIELEQFKVPSADLALKTFSAFPAAETLSCDEGVLANLLDQQRELGNMFFPRLKHLKVGTLIAGYFTGAGAHGYLFDFLQSRQEAGCPVLTLDLTRCNPDVSPKLTRLEAIKGLKIFWKMWSADEILEYECGSGHPEKIPFPHGGVFQAPLKFIRV